MEPPSKEQFTPTQEDDVVITVTLSKQDYEIMRDMIEKQKSMNLLGRYIKGILFVAIPVLVTLITFGEQLKKYFAAFITALSSTTGTS